MIMDLAWLQGERMVPELLAKSPSRRRRIARGSGRTEVDVSNMLVMFANMRSKMKELSKLMNMQGAAGELNSLFNSDLKPPPSCYAYMLSNSSPPHEEIILNYRLGQPCRRKFVPENMFACSFVLLNPLAHPRSIVDILPHACVGVGTPRIISVIYMVKAASCMS